MVDSVSVGRAGDWKSDTCGRGEKIAEREIPAGDDTMPVPKLELKLESETEQGLEHSCPEGLSAATGLTRCE
jgi:hypothetical protein